MDPTQFTAAGLAEAYRRRLLSPVEVTSRILRDIERTQESVNAYRLIDPEAALAQARASEQRWLRDAPLSPLDGVPAGIKDLLHVQGWPTRKGSLATSDDPQPQDAPAAARLREWGAVLLGKTNTSEFGWKNLTETALSGVTRNPWSLDHTSAGSSGGAAAAAALGLGVLQVGTDGAGSIRMPAAACGVFGFKPSFGRVPVYPPAHNGNLFHAGPITRSVTDAALLLDCIGGYDPRDWTALPPAGRSWRTGLESGIQGMRIAYSRTLGYGPVAEEIARLVDRAVARFAELGAHVEEACPGLPHPQPLYEVLAAERAIRLRQEIPPARFDLIDADIRHAAEAASRFGLRDWLEVQDLRQSMAITMRRFHERYDLLLTPALRESVPRVGNQPDNALLAPFNLTQQPAASVPIGLDSAGLPVALHIVGPPHRDDWVLRAARAFERIQPWPVP